LAQDDFLLLFAGSGWERKGLPFVLSALEKIADPRLKLVVAGKGRALRNAPEGVRFVGSMVDLENAYAAADVFVFPPIYEPSANVVFEALAAGLPVVTSACNGAAEVIEEGINGTVVADPSDIGALAAAIEFWRARPNVRPVPVKADLSLERNVRETLAVLELAAAERAAEQS
jgi:UDP-glucose:(heptosyl)LPS alpha-1,3-glucosyltransferase